MNEGEIEIQRLSGADAPDDALLCRWARHALATTGACGDLVLRLVDAPESRALNAQYRHKDAPTNVLSFPAARLPDAIAELVAVAPLGDLVICAEVVNAEAQAQGKSPQAHWAHMVVHGCLHLQGYDHVNERDAQLMENLERQLLAEFQFPDPYEEKETH